MAWYDKPDGTQLSEQERWDNVAPLVDIIEMNCPTMKEALIQLTELARVNDWPILPFPTSVCFVYGKAPWESVIVMHASDGRRVYDYHTSFKLIM